jgi:hypothetical protein
MAAKPGRSSRDEKAPILAGAVTRRILTLRGHNVMLDSDLAELYEVETFNLNKAVKRNLNRFPEDFMFQLTKKEHENLRFQVGISSSKHGGRRYLPFVFTQEGVAMLSSVLNSDRAIQVNIGIMRAFVQLRRLAETHKDLAEKIATLEKKYDAQFSSVFNAIRQLLQPPVRRSRTIGFVVPRDRKKQ